jgi:hypothetical protein
MATGESTPNVEVDAHLDSVLRASGSSLRHYTAAKTLEDMRAAMRKAMSSAPSEIAPSMDDLMRRNQRLETALIEITKGEGAFSREPLEHATNCIESMKQLAKDALHE